MAVVDDVVTTGGSTLQAISACREAGLEIVGVLTLVDRQEMNGRENIEKQIPNFKALFTRDEVMRMYRAASRRCNPQVRLILTSPILASFPPSCFFLPHPLYKFNNGYFLTRNFRLASLDCLSRVRRQC